MFINITSCLICRQYCICKIHAINYRYCVLTLVLYILIGLYHYNDGSKPRLQQNTLERFRCRLSIYSKCLYEKANRLSRCCNKAMCASRKWNCVDIFVQAKIAISDTIIIYSQFVRGKGFELRKNRF